MFEAGGYKSALCLSGLIALISCICLLSLAPQGNANLESHAVLTVLVTLGLWLQSGVARYLGALYYLSAAGVGAFALVNVNNPVNLGIGVGLAATLMFLGLPLASILLLSKTFAREFAVERERRPAYKKILLYALTALIVAVVVVDIVRVLFE
jgi:hypothetical protein